MFDYLQKFNALPQNLRDSVSSPAAMAVIADLEKKYKIDLAAVVMKVMVKNILLSDLAAAFVSDFSLDPDSAKKLTAELKERLFFPVANYLGYIASYSSVVPKVAPISSLPISERVIKEAGLVFPGADLNQRLKIALETYLKGIRSRVDTRITLNKPIISGGLGLEHKDIDKIFSISDKLSAAPEKASTAPVEPIQSKTGLEKVRALYEKQELSRDIPYDLSAAIAKKEISKPITPFNLPIPAEREEKLLEAKEEELLIAAPKQKHNAIPEEKKEVPVPVKPVIKAVASNPEQAASPVPSPKSVPLNQPAPSIPKTATTSVPNAPIPPVIPIPNIKPSEPKIIKPAEKGPSLWSRMFNKKDEKEKVVPAAPVTLKAAPAQNVSVAAKRMEATAVKTGIPQRPSAETVRQAPRVMSPIDELRFLDLINFRRLGADPSECISKVSDKIKLLEKQGYEKMISGISAWKQSPVNKLYLKMGQEALKKGQSLKDFALAAEAAKTSTLLSWEEIQLIIKLNNQFMY